MSDAKTRSISPENFTGEKGKGGMATLEEGNAARAARELALLFYQVDYILTDVLDDAAYFHAQFNRVHPLPVKEVFTIVDNIKGKGQYVGTYLAHGAYGQGWWGEGEIKFFMDGDTDFPTICGTGEEDYFCGSYAYNKITAEDGVTSFTEFSSPYTGFYYSKDDDKISYATKVGQYRWLIGIRMNRIILFQNCRNRRNWLFRLMNINNKNISVVSDLHLLTQ